VPCASGDELVSLGFRVGSPSAIGGIGDEFSSIPVTHRCCSDNEQKNRRRAVCAEKWPEAKPSRWSAYASSAHRKGQKPSPAAGDFFIESGDALNHAEARLGRMHF